MAQVDLGTRQNRHQPLHALSAMALAVLATAERRVHGAAVAAAAPGPLLVPRDGELEMRSVVLDERPPLAQGVRGAARLGLMRAYARRRAFSSASYTWRLPAVIASRTRRS